MAHLGAAAAEALANDAALGALRDALRNVLDGGEPAVAAFCRGFGPRRLMKLLGKGDIQSDDEFAELADRVIEACSTTSSCYGDMTAGFAVSQDFTEVHKESMYPDTHIELSRPLPGQEAPLQHVSHEPVHLRLRTPTDSDEDGVGCDCRFVPAYARVEPTSHGARSECGTRATAVLKLTTPSRRSCFGAEIECKVWPAAILLARWLWCHSWLVKGRCILELGAGVGTAGLAASLAGARRVFITDISSTALELAKRNVNINGANVQQAARVLRLDWADPPPALPEIAGKDQADAAEQAETELELARLTGKVDLLIAADVINSDGLSQLVYRMIIRYLAPRGLFIMVAPLPFHRHTVDVIREMLLSSPIFETHILPVPSWLAQAVAEATDIQHEIYVVQWRKSPTDDSADTKM
ncbi:hypothetical protein AB1Y20_001435 [Prymnesium parvum]|uniref:Calmodulin-lysine N-methyltransferase n=1 Tax=Prymnesium parvum TaxID=97485 RepID=A0AB34K7R0_PRYPA